MIFTAAALAARPADGTSVDSPSGRVRCHAELPADEARCREVVLWAEEALAAQVERLGFRGPLPDRGLGGSDALDVYLTRTAGGAGQAFVDCDGGDPACEDADPADGLSAAPAYVVIDPRTKDRDFRHFVHHELAHVWQYATDYAEPSLALWEGTAAACERWTDPAWTTSAADLADFQRAPWLSPLLADGNALKGDSWYEYGAMAWVLWLDATHGRGDGALAPRLWELAARDGANVLDAWDELTGDGREALLAFTADRARMGTPSGPAWATFAGRRARAHREPMRGVRFAPERPPFPLGATFVDLVGPVEVQLEGDPAVGWAVLAVQGAERRDLGATGGRVDLEGPFTLAVVNLGPPGFDGSAASLVPSGFVLRVRRGAPE